MKHRAAKTGGLARLAGGAAVSCALLLPAPTGIKAEPVWSPSATRAHCAIRYEVDSAYLLMRCVGKERDATEVMDLRLQTYLTREQQEATGAHPLPLPDPPPQQSIPGYTT